MWKTPLSAAVSNTNSQSESDHNVQCGIAETTAHQRRVHDGHVIPFGIFVGSFGAPEKGTSTTSVQSCVGLCRVTACPSGFGFLPATGTETASAQGFMICTDSET